jgi:hypothetical protein
VSKGRRAVTHTDERRANNTPVRNQFQELSEHQEDPTSLAPRELIVEFSQLTELQTEEEIPATDPSGMINSRNWSRISVDNLAASLFPGLWVGPMFSPCSDLLE